MESQQREILSMILDRCDPETYVSLTETGLRTTYPINRKQNAEKQREFKEIVRNRRKGMIKEGVIGKIEKGFAEGKNTLNEGLLQLTSSNPKWVEDLSEIYLNHSDLFDQMSAEPMKGENEEENKVLQAELSKKLMMALSPSELESFLNADMLRLARTAFEAGEMEEELNDPSTFEMLHDLGNDPEIGAVFDGWRNQIQAMQDENDEINEINEINEIDGNE
jgi:hypothetical protein